MSYKILKLRGGLLEVCHWDVVDEEVCYIYYTTDMSKSVQYRGVQYFPYIARIRTGLLFQLKLQ